MTIHNLVGHTLRAYKTMIYAIALEMHTLCIFNLFSIPSNHKSKIFQSIPPIKQQRITKQLFKVYIL